jgi:N-acetylglucosaminyldiphosphoundecaprenol N-acetyl-beta-D-mannosaminyltransferase
MTTTHAPSRRRGSASFAVGAAETEVSAYERLDSYPDQTIKHISIGGARVTTASRAELTAAMVKDCLAARDARRPIPSKLVFDLNGNAMSLRETDPAYRVAFDAADIVHADGQFLIPVSKWLVGQPIAERSATTDLIHDLLKAAEPTGLRFYFLGGTPEVIEQFVVKIRQLYPRLQIAGYHHGFFAPTAEAAIIDDINHSLTDVLCLGLGKPKEVPFAYRNRTEVRAGWTLTVGGCFNYVTGHYRRAPLWMQKASLEWVFRMVTSPRQLFWRYLTSTPHAMLLVALKTKRQGPP